METLNFTQFCTKYGYPSDYDTMFQAQLLGSRGLAGRISKRNVSKQDEDFHAMQAKNSEAKKLFYQAVKNGTLIDGSGELTQSGILQKEKQLSDDAVKSEIETLKGKIKFIESLGQMSHLKSGKLKKGYQWQVDDYNNRIKQLTENFTNKI